MICTGANYIYIGLFTGWLAGYTEDVDFREFDCKICEVCNKNNLITDGELPMVEQNNGATILDSCSEHK